MLNLYTDLDQMRGRYIHDSALATTDKAELLRVMGQACRQVDDYCERWFYALTATRHYDGNGKTELWLSDDVLSITTLKVDEDGDLVYEVDLTEETDFWLWPDNATPKIRIDINPQGNKISRWPTGRKRIEIAGTFGYSNVTEGTGDTVQDNPLSAVATTITVKAAGSKFSIGQTLLIESEQVWISDIDANGLTVTRGVNGTTAASHVQNTAISRFVYEDAIVGAAAMWAGRLWKRRETADATTIINPMMGTLEVHRGMDQDVRLALDPYRAKVLV